MESVPRVSYTLDMPGSRGEFIAHVDAAILYQLRWPILRVLAPGYVEHVELTRYLDHLLATGDWLSVRAIPSRAEGQPTRAAPHEFEIYGIRSLAGENVILEQSRR
jgi:hypothetical protein